MYTDELTLNPLPSLTWQRLKVNDARVKITGKQDAAIRTLSLKASLPNGLVLRMAEEDSVICHRAQEGSPGRDACRQAAASGIYKIPREAYVAGKTAIRAGEGFPTGLGEQFQHYMEPEPLRILEIPEGYTGDEPAFLAFIHNDDSDAALRLLIHAGEGSDTKVILCSRSCGACSMVCADTENTECRQSEKIALQIVLEKGARLELNRVNLLDQDALLLDDVGVYEAEDAHFTYRKADLGARNSYGGCSVYEAGDRSGSEIEIAYLKTGSQVLDMNYHVIHGGRNSTSRITLKGVLGDTSSKTFRGTIDFRKGCKGADGDEREEVCLLDDAVINRTVPVILCEEEDVDGRHGASIGRMNEEELFYCESRGINEEEARLLLVRGRLMSIISGIPDEGLRREIKSRIAQVLVPPSGREDASTGNAG